MPNSGNLISRWAYGLLLLLISSHAHAAVPDWVRAAAGATLPKYEADVNAVVLLNEVTFTITSADEYVEHQRRIVKILRPDGRDEANFGIHFRGKEKFSSLHAWSIDSGGHEYELKDKEFAERGFDDFELYSDVRYRTITAPAGNPGTVVAFETEVKRRPWLHHLRWDFQEDVPIHETHVVLHMPQGWEYKDYWAGIPATPSMQSGNNAEWRMMDMREIKHEDMSPPEWALAGRLEIAYLEPGESPKNAASWDALGNGKTS